MIPLFGKNKKKNKLFGGSVTPDCRYCQHNSAEDGEAVCFALVLAEVVYDGEGFSLSGLRLVSAHGV